MGTVISHHFGWRGARATSFIIARATKKKCADSVAAFSRAEMYRQLAGFPTFRTVSRGSPIIKTSVVRSSYVAPFPVVCPIVERDFGIPREDPGFRCDGHLIRDCDHRESRPAKGACAPRLFIVNDIFMNARKDERLCGRVIFFVVMCLKVDNMKRRNMCCC